MTANHVTHLKILAGVRTDDILAAAIIFKCASLSGMSVLFPSFIPNDSLRLRQQIQTSLQLGNVVCVVGHHLESQDLKKLLAMQEYAQFPLFWDNHRSSYHYREINGTIVSIGESIAASVAWYFRHVIKSENVDKFLFLDKYSDIIDKSVESLNLRTFMLDKNNGQRMNVLPEIYDPAQLMITFNYSPEKFEQLLNSSSVNEYLMLEQERIIRTRDVMQEISHQNGLKTGIVSQSTLYPSDCDNACATYLKSEEGGTFDSIIIINWDRRFSGQIHSIQIRTLNAESEIIADRLMKVCGINNCYIEKVSRNRATVYIKSFKGKYTGKNAITNIIANAVKRAYIDIEKDFTETDIMKRQQIVGYKDMVSTLPEKAEKLINKKNHLGEFKQCLNVAELDKFQDF